MPKNENGGAVRALRIFRRLCGVAVLAGAWSVPGYADIPAGPPAAVETLPQDNWFSFFWHRPKNLGDPPASEFRARFRRVDHDWSNQNGANGQSAKGGLMLFAEYRGAGGWFSGGYFTKGEEWEVQLAYANSNGVIGEWSPLLRVTIGAPHRPRNPVIARGASGFRLDWQNSDSGSPTLLPTRPSGVGETPTGRRVRWRREGESTYTSTDLPKSATSHHQTGLVPGAEYYVQVGSVNLHGVSPWTPVLSELPVIAATPYLEPRAEKAGSLEVWRVNDPGTAKNAVRWRRALLNPEDNWANRESASPTGTYLLSAEEHGLQPGVLYDVQLSSHVNGNWQSWSPSATGRASRREEVSPRLDALEVAVSATDAGGANTDARMLYPDFSPEVFSYSIDLPSAVTLAEITARSLGSPTVRVDDIAVNSSDKAVLSLTAGEGKIVKLRVTSRLGPVTTYTLTINRDRLLALEAAVGELIEIVPLQPDVIPGDKLALQPAFSPRVHSYNLSVSQHVSKVRLHMAVDPAVDTLSRLRELGLDPVSYDRHARLEDIDDAGLEAIEIAADATTKLTIQIRAGSEDPLLYELFVHRARLLQLPDAPLGLRADAGAAKIDVAWVEPDNPHAANKAPSGYRVRWRFLPDGPWQNAAGNNDDGELLAADARAYTIRGRLYFLEHEVQVAAVNDDGAGAWATVMTDAVQVPAPAAEYELLTDADGGNPQLRVEMPLNTTHTELGFFLFDSEILPHGVQIKTAGAVWPVVQLSGAQPLPVGITRTSSDTDARAGQFTFSGFAAGENYDARAYYTYHDLITNLPAAGTFSAPARINIGAPPAPLVKVESSDQTLTAKWTMPNNALASGYQVRWKLAQATEYLDPQDAADGALEHAISGLSNQLLYHVQVAARNTFGIGDWSAAATAAPGRSGVPLDVSAKPEDGALSLSWTVPAEVSGNELSGYRVRWSERASPETWLSSELGKSLQPEQTTYTLANLTNRTEYLVQVGAYNSTIGANFADPVYATPYAPIAFPAETAVLRLHTGREIDLPLQSASGGLLPHVYRIAGLPGELRFDNSGNAPPRISGTPIFGDAITTYRVIDPIGNEAMQTLTIDTNNPTSIDTPDLEYVVGVEKSTTLDAATAGFMPYAYSLEGDLNGLTFDPDTRILGGIARHNADFTLTYTATDDTGLAGGRAAQDLTITMTADQFIQSPRNLQSTRGDGNVMLSWDKPSNISGTTHTGYQVRWKQGANAGALDTADWGAPKSVTGTTTLTDEIPDIANSAAYAAQVASVGMSGSIGPWSESARGIPPTFVKEVEMQRLYTRPTAYNITLPEAEGGEVPYSYALSALPAGLRFDSATRVLSGIPTEAAETMTMTYTATDAALATVSQQFDITIEQFGLDVDGDGSITVRDGIMVARYLLGVRGAALTAGQTNTPWEVVAANIEAGMETEVLDVNDDGNIDGDDGILIARYLFGLRGEALMKGDAEKAKKIEERVRALGAAE